MTDIFATVTDVETKVVETVRKLQEPVVAYVRKGVAYADDKLPTFEYPESFPSPSPSSAPSSRWSTASRPTPRPEPHPRPPAVPPPGGAASALAVRRQVTAVD